MEAREDIARIKSAVCRIAQSFDIRRVFLFGSHSRGEARADSDVDLCLETGKTFSLFNASDFSQQASLALGCPVDVVTENSLYPFVRASMIEDRVLLYEQV